MEAIRNRISLEEAKPLLSGFCSQFDSIILSTVDQQGYPKIDTVIYHFIEGKHYILIGPELESFHNMENANVAGMLIPADKMSVPAIFRKNITYRFSAKEVEEPKKVYQKLSDDEIKTFKHILKQHHGKLFELKVIDGIFNLGFKQSYLIDHQDQVVDLAKGEHGEKQFEHSRLILMRYGDKEKVMSAYVENETYYILTKQKSKKIKYFQKDPVCMIYDGKDNHFRTKVNINTSKQAIEEMFNKFDLTNNNYFNENKDLVLLEFSK